VRDAFDDIVQDALRSKRGFSGDGRDVAAAMNEARGLHAELRQTFSKQGGGDKVGPTMQAIIGRQPGQAMPANQLAATLFGTGEKPVLLGRRLVQLFGQQSPEVAAVKQGWFSHITERPEGVTAWTPDKIADRIYDAIRGKGRALADTYLSLGDQQRWLAYADRLRAMPRAVPQEITKAVPGYADSHEGFARTLFGTDGVGENPLGVRIAQHVMDTYGPQSDAANALRRGQFSRLVDYNSGRAGFDAKSVADNIERFLDGDGNAMANTLYSPREQQTMREYAKELRDHEAATAVSKDPVDRAIDRIVGRNGHAPASALETVEMITGAAAKTKDKQLAIDIARRLKGMLGENSPQWGCMRQALFHHLDQGGPQAAVKNFDEFFDKRGMQLANEVFGPDHIDAIKKYVDWKCKLIVPPNGKNYSRTATFTARVNKYLSGRVADMIGGFVGAGVGFLTHGPIGAVAGHMVGAGVAHDGVAPAASGSLAAQPLTSVDIRQHRGCFARVGGTKPSPELIRRIATRGARSGSSSRRAPSTGAPV